MQSVAIVEEAGFSQVHAFPYSPREGTNAYKKYKELSSAIKKERVERILQASAAQKEKYLKGFIGKTLTIVPERCIDGVTEGYAENYIRVYVQGETDKTLKKVRVTGLKNDGVSAELI